MPTPLFPPTAAEAPTGETLTDYDREHLIVYLRLLDAAADHADWREVARLVLGLDPDQDSPGAERAFESHLDRARWMARSGYLHLLQERPEG
jgi:hypothetical protein